MAAPVVRRLGVDAFGLGGAELRAAGVELLTDASSISAMGIGSVLARAPRIASAARKLLARAKQLRPRAALLVGYSEFNGWLGPRLRELGTRVLWYAPPQVWAWRGERAPTLKHACDRMAVILPFEQRLWPSHGVSATYVGHPALEAPSVSRDAARERFGMTPYAEYVAVLPGSRPREVSAHLPAMLEAVALLRAERGALDARIVLTPTLPRRVADGVARRAAQAGVSVISSNAPPVLPACDVALAASGTVTMECVLSEVPPVIGYRTGALSEAMARRYLSIDHVGLPNIVLGRGVFPELLQSALTADALADEAGRLLDEREAWLSRCRAVRASLEEPLEEDTEMPSERVAEHMKPWLS